MDKLAPNEIELIKKLSDAFGPSGLEDEIATIVYETCAGDWDVSADSMGNLFVMPLPDPNAKVKYALMPEVILDAHMDEVGFMVQTIHANGTITLLPIGGWNLKNAFGSPFMIRTSDGRFRKAVGVSQPVHYSQSDPDEQTLLVDAGFSNREQVLNFGIAPGDFAVPDTKCTYSEEDGLFQGKSFDDRIGIAAEILTLKRVKELHLEDNVLALFSVQEEVGERGAKAAMNRIQYGSANSAAICFEGCPADDTFAIDGEAGTVMNGGPMIRAMDRSMVTDTRLMDLTRKIAAENKIPVQITVRSGGGTNAAVFQQNNIPSLVIGIPVRYAHCVSGFCSGFDLVHAVNLAVAMIQEFCDEDSEYHVDKLAKKMPKNAKIKPIEDD